MNSDDHYSEIGALLRTARVSMRLSLEEAGRQLHIRVRYLEALEQGKFDALPGITYAKGYLRSYASHLQLDQDEILRRFEAVEATLAQKGLYFPQLLAKEKTPNSSVLWGSLGAALLVYVLWLAVLRPHHADIAVIEAAPEKLAVPLSKPKDGACFHPQDALYPPCYRMREPQLSLPPLNRQINTIMELAQ